MSVNFSVRTQANAYQEGHRAAIAMLVDALLERGMSADLIDVLEMNATAADRRRIDQAFGTNRPEGSES